MRIVRIYSKDKIEVLMGQLEELDREGFKFIELSVGPYGRIEAKGLGKRYSYEKGDCILEDLGHIESRREVKHLLKEWSLLN